MKRLTPTPGIEGRVLRRGEEGYEHHRRGTCWHDRVPDRHPEVIVVATSEDDVVGAVQLAQREGLQVAVRSGGHSWSGSHLRDGTVLIDLSNLRRVEIDSAGLTAVAGPGIQGVEFNAMLVAEDLFFPTGHSPGICLGGYLLQGGFGWAGRDYGPACMSVIGIDVVTADGEIVHADEEQNTDLLWAARGAGPGFFAVVTRFHLRLYPRRPVTMSSTYFYPKDAIPEVLGFVHEIGRQTPTEVAALVIRHPMADGEPLITLTAVAFTDSEEQALEQLALFESCPARARALEAHVNVLGDHATIGRDLDADWVAGGPLYDTQRWVADNMATHASFDALWPTLEQMVDTWPGSPTNLVVFNWAGYDRQPERPPMAFSVEDEIFYGLYVAWSDPAADEAHVRWVTDHMRAWEPFASGIMLADENLANRPFRFVSEENLRRLDVLRDEWDREGRFVSWLGRPDPR